MPNSFAFSISLHVRIKPLQQVYVISTSSRFFSLSPPSRFWLRGCDAGSTLLSQPPAPRVRSQRSVDIPLRRYPYLLQSNLLLSLCSGPCRPSLISYEPGYALFLRFYHRQLILRLLRHWIPSNFVEFGPGRPEQSFSTSRPSPD